MKKQIVAIGGTDIREEMWWGIDRYIVDLVGRSQPKACFLGTATGDDPGYFSAFEHTYGSLGCSTSRVPFFGRTPDLRDALTGQDIIYVGGGNTRSMLAVWREWGADKVLREAYESGVVLAGVSAGAICWFEQGLTDSSDAGMLSLDCLGFVKGSCCPHYDSEVERRPVYKGMVGSGELLPGYALCEGTALHFIDGKPHQVIGVLPASKAYYVFNRNGNVIEGNLAEQESL